MTTRDPELLPLLIAELSRHLVTLEGVDETLEAVRRAVHALKGSAGLAGEAELSQALARLERRMRDGDDRARAETAAVVTLAVERLSAGKSAVIASWPEPPTGLLPRSLDPSMRVQYAAEVQDRIAQIDGALADDQNPLEAAAEIYRHIHTIKGAASAVGDEPMSWFCHGLEERLRPGTTSTEAARGALLEMSDYRAVLGAFLDDPDAALLSLAGRQNPTRKSLRPSIRPDDDLRPDDATIRIATGAVDRVLDQLAIVSVIQDRLMQRAPRAQRNGRMSRKLRAELTEALRLIGPPRPWGAPAAALRRVEAAASALSAMADEMETASQEIKSDSLLLKESTTSARAGLSQMRETKVAGIFRRIASAVEAEARRAGKLVRVSLRGAEEIVDRRLAEHLFEPLLQIARNSVAHGIETPDVRTALVKDQVASVQIAARRVGSRLVVSISDDGAGVDVDVIRERAVSAGNVTASLAQAADDNTLLGLLFLPGFSTRDSSDLLAGRGIGLDIALLSVQRLGGTIRLSSKQGRGFEATVEVPIESGFARVLWVTAADRTYALLADAARKVDLNEGLRVAHLGACLDARPNMPAPYVVELDLGETQPLLIGVDAIHETNEVLLRPLTSIVRALGPYAGAVARTDGTLALAIDPFALAPRARAIGRIPEGRPSDSPLSRPPPASAR